MHSLFLIYPFILTTNIMSLFNTTVQAHLGGMVVSWLGCSPPDRAVWIRALAGNIVLCSCIGLLA